MYFTLRTFVELLASPTGGWKWGVPPRAPRCRPVALRHAGGADDEVRRETLTLPRTASAAQSGVGLAVPIDVADQHKLVSVVRSTVPDDDVPLLVPVEPE